MGGIFGKSKKKVVSRVTEQDKAVLQLKQQRDKLKQYQKKILANLEKERQVARQLLLDGKKDKAKLLLRKKRFMEQMLDKTDGQLMNLERMVHDIEYAQIELQVVEGLKVGNQALKTMHELLSIEDIEKLMDETQEGIEKQREIDELLSGGLTTEDEESVLAELDALVAEEMPSVPADKVSAEKPEEELELPEVPSEEPLPAKKAKVHQPQMVEAS